MTMKWTCSLVILLNELKSCYMCIGYVREGVCEGVYEGVCVCPACYGLMAAGMAFKPTTGRK